MSRCLQWNDPQLKGCCVGRPLAIVSTAPSYDEVDLTGLEQFDVFAINGAITEHWRHPNCHWVVHDLFKMWRGPFGKKIAGYHPWRLITRKVYLPGRAGNVPYRAVGGGKIMEPFSWRIPANEFQKADVYWYTELPELAGFVRPTETSVEVALDVAQWWGHTPVVIVGVDFERKDGHDYASPWRWKRCCIKDRKFVAMRKIFKQKRDSWPERVYHTSPYWRGAPFEHVLRPLDVLKAKK